MIRGVGTDIIEISRIRKAVAKKGFTGRVFTPAERRYCESASNPDYRFAGRFAAKEAVAKSLGVSLSWQEVEILPDSAGKPEVRLHGRAVAAAAGIRILVSISHCRSYAVASAVAESV